MTYREDENKIWWDCYFLELTTFISYPSKDPSTKVGCVIIDDQRRIISTGYNGFARQLHDSKIRLDNRTLKLQLTIHAETNALIYAKQDLTNCKLYSSRIPCGPCAGLIVQAGIKEVIYLTSIEYEKRWKDSIATSLQVFDEANLNMVALTKEDINKYLE